MPLASQLDSELGSPLQGTRRKTNATNGNEVRREEEGIKWEKCRGHVDCGEDFSFSSVMEAVGVL